MHALQVWQSPQCCQEGGDKAWHCWRIQPLHCLLCPIFIIWNSLLVSCQSLMINRSIAASVYMFGTAQASLIELCLITDSFLQVRRLCCVGKT